MSRLGRASGAGSVGLESYDREYFWPLHEDIDHRADGGIVEAERTTSETGVIVDRVAFQIELHHGAMLVARVT